MKNSALLCIKNMVCPRCIAAVEGALNTLHIEYQSVALGQVRLARPLPPETIEQLAKHIKTLGFDVLESSKSALISKIKTLIIEQIHYSKDPIKVNFSTLIADKLNHEYTYLSRLFSNVESITIEKYTMLQRIEKVKELLIYNEMTLSEIACQMHYSSVAHLSAQFKKETGMTPTHFKRQSDPKRKFLDNISPKF